VTVISSIRIQNVLTLSIVIIPINLAVISERVIGQVTYSGMVKSASVLTIIIIREFRVLVYSWLACFLKEITTPVSSPGQWVCLCIFSNLKPIGVF